MKEEKSFTTQTFPHPKLLKALEKESQKFKEAYLWLEKAMPEGFFKEISPDNMLLVSHSLIGFPLQDYYSIIHLKGGAIVLSLDTTETDLRILQQYSTYGIKNYQTFVSKIPLNLEGVEQHLKIAILTFFEEQEGAISKETKEIVRQVALEKNPQLTAQELEALTRDLSAKFLSSLSRETLSMAIAMYFRAKTRDSCQYEIKYNLNWQEDNLPSMQIVLAWKNTPKHAFLYRLARTIYRHKLALLRVDATYVNPYTPESILLMTMDLHGANGESVSDVADIPNFLRELMTVKYFASFDCFDEHLVSKGIIQGSMANVLRAMVSFIHQALVHLDPHVYTLENIQEGLCRHPDLTSLLCDVFQWKFDPDLQNPDKYLATREQFLKIVEKLDTGQEELDIRRKNILNQAMSMIEHTLKTNAYRLNFTSLSFRLDPRYIEKIPHDLSKKFPERPYAIFFIKGMHFFGFHIRFEDLARGGLRTVYPDQKERVTAERNNIFTECYNLALTQDLKNKDIPEGGAKGIIFLKPSDSLDDEISIYKRELKFRNEPQEVIDQKIDVFKKELNLDYLHQAQRSFIESLLILVNCENDGKLVARRIVDYWKQPEYLYLGPDENMHDSMIQWIADYSKKYHYKPGSSFISSKPKAGINHKEYGVTSLGINVYMQEFLKYIGIDPYKDPFTVKIVGGPDGDVAGNQIVNLYKHFPKTAKLLSVTDISGCAYDPQGLNLKELTALFSQGKPIRFFSPKNLSKGGFLLDKFEKMETSPLTQKTVLYRMEDTLHKDWISGSEMHTLLKNNVFKTETDLFIPAGGRPRTLNESNWKEFLTERGRPSSKIIIEGANLYLTPYARRELEKLGTLIVKDSSANKTGVICSSFEVLCGLTLGDDAFLENKETLVKEILQRLESLAYQEAQLMISEHRNTGLPLTDISGKISERINLFSEQLMVYLNGVILENNPNDPLIKCFLSYCLPILKTRFEPELLKEIPDTHKKAIIACHIGAQLVYKKGLKWLPSLVDILPFALQEITLN